MLKNFFRAAFRTIIRNKVYAIISFVGLTVGLTLALLITAYVRSEVSYDRFHSKIDRLYRIKYTAPNGLELASSPPPIAPKLKEYFTEVEDAARLYVRNVTVSLPNSKTSFEETNVYFADSSITNMFSFEVLKGDIDNALKDEFTVIITDEMATKYFGDKDPIGETLIFSGDRSFKVTGVVKKYPDHSHISFNMLVPYENMFDLESDAASQLMRNNLAVNFVISHSYTYVLLNPGANPSNVDNRMGDFLKKYALPQLQVGQVFTLTPVADIHLQSTMVAEPSATNSITNIYIFIGVGILTLLIACINYVNLSTAQSLTRIKEVGIRKLLGSQKYQLILQFLAESFLFCVGSLMMAFVAFYFALPYLNELTQKNLVFVEVVDLGLIAFSLILVVSVTLLAGGYPAYFIATFDSIHALKSQVSRHGGTQLMRKLLVAFQLTVACVLLSGALLIMKQLNFLNEKSLGFQKSGIINVSLFSNNLNGIFRQNDSTFWSRLQTYRDAIESQSGIKGTTLSSNPPGLGAIFRGTIPEGFTQEDNMFVANSSVDEDFLKAFEMELAAGRNFSHDFPSDAQDAFIVNETAVSEWGWGDAENALGKEINREGKKGKVIGVVKDFNFSSLTTPVGAMVLEKSPNQFTTLSIHFEKTNIAERLDDLQSKWNELFPEKSFEYAFFDTQLENQYSNFINFGTIIKVFTAIAMLISCLGVYGLVLFIVQHKVKEIGVRKVLGATVSSILKLICKDFALLLVIAFMLSIPISYWLIDQWMENFTFRASIGVVPYLIGFVVLALVVGITVSYHAFMASIANPVKSLRSE